MSAKVGDGKLKIKLFVDRKCYLKKNTTIQIIFFIKTINLKRNS